MENAKMVRFKTLTKGEVFEVSIHKVPCYFIKIDYIDYTNAIELSNGCPFIFDEGQLVTPLRGEMRGWY